MDTNTLPALTDVDDPMLRLAVAAHLARYKGQSRAHTASDLNTYLRWCLEKDLRLQAQPAHVELYLRWLQEVRHLRPSTVSRRLSVLATFYRTCVIDQILSTHPPSTSDARTSHSSRRHSGSATCSSRPSSPPAATPPTPTTLHSSRCSDCSAYACSRRPARTSKRLAKLAVTVSSPCTERATRPPWCRFLPLSAVPSTRRSPNERSARSCSTATADGWTGMQPPAACEHSPGRPTSRPPACTHTCCATRS
ncbi:phage integrase N-terminal SAM-like domain-containing protein [Nocardioides sp. zg-1228]|nr:phage integrase N-terminal SAM-like domain-containing protein [Nocardioides sp. zg-1228]